jgi:hypothetical protein
MARVVLNKDQLYELLSGPNGAVGKDLKRRATRVQNKARQLCRVDTGQLRASITTEPGKEHGELVYRVGTNVEYARYIEKRYPFLGPALSEANY